jgi:hydroxymethylbilane synthase
VTEGEIRIGTRGSALALAQARLVSDAIEKQGGRTRFVIVETAGDRRTPDTAWGEGAFVAAIEGALLDHRVDVAVHSAKDVPTEEDPRVRIGAYLSRADPRDALVVRAGSKERRLDDLPMHSRVGTDSPRRTGFLLARRPDLVVHPLHGNVDTRLRRLDDGETDALVLACAGLDRMGLADRIAERLEPGILPPAPGQGAIAIQVRRDDGPLSVLLATIDDEGTRLAVEAERAFLHASGGGCRAPIGALATIHGQELDLLGGYASPDGSQTAIDRRRGPIADGAAVAVELATRLDSRARIRTIAAAAKSRAPLPMAPRVLVTRATEQADGLIAALCDAGLDPVPVPTIVVELAPGDELDAAVAHIGEYRWVVVTSANGARGVLEASRRVGAARHAVRWAAVGQGTGALLEREEIEVDFRPSRASGEALADELPVARGDRVLLVRGDLASARMAMALRARGAQVDDIVAYRTREAPPSSGVLLRRARADGPLQAIVFTSGSTVRGLVALALAENLHVASIPSVCIGEETARRARAAGFTVIGIATTADALTLATATADALAAHAEEIR